MQHIKVIFEVPDQATSDILIALLGEIGYDGFEETGNELYAYINEEHYSKQELNNSIAILDIVYREEVIPAQNWNALWESNFQPVIVADFCTIRAHFHDIEVVTPFDIVITPKMSFGTGHHATTQLMMMQMKDLDIKGKSVLDFGTGTGVLAILAEMLGAGDILAIDNDEWSVENANENIERNSCKNIEVKQGSLEVAKGYSCELILANINRHILLHYMADLYAQLPKNSQILMSGLLVEDRGIIETAAAKEGFHFNKITELNNWISILFDKL